MSQCARQVMRNCHPRRGAIAVLFTVLLVLILACVACAVDIGYLCFVRTQLQASADAAALAGAQELLLQHNAQPPADPVTAQLAVYDAAAAYAARNVAGGLAPALIENPTNDPSGDVVIGRIERPEDQSATMTFTEPDRYNSVFVRVRRDDFNNGPISMFFAKALGVDFVSVTAQATASFDDGGINGIRVRERSQVSELLPFALHIDDWNNLLSGRGDDFFAYDAETGDVIRGSDGVPETKLYPQTDNGKGGVAPGNFGTVDIGNAGNSTNDLIRQIGEGISADDLAVHGGQLMLDPDLGTLLVEGDTGISAAMHIEQALPSIVGDSRIVLLYSQVAGSGDNAVFTIVGFAGVRVVDFNLTGALSRKYILIQPALVIDQNVVTTEDLGRSQLVYPPIRLTR